MQTFLILLALLGLANTGIAWRHFLRGRAKHGNLGEPVLSKKYELPNDQWFEQFLDHFNPTDARTWQQRYFVNSSYFKKGGPVFLMIGGEGTASAKWMVEGQWIEYAKQFGALCFQLEHRFYGKSHPTSDLSIKNMVYLSSEQALADLAYFIEGMNRLYQIPAGTKWIAFGGSYPGSLAAWLRAKYPHLVHGAMSASGPLLAQIDFQQYYVIVEKALRTHSDACVKTVEAANNQIHIMLRHRIGQEGLKKKFNLCEPIDPGHTKTRDIANLYENLASNFADVVQYNKDNRNSSKTSNITIDTICDILTNETIGVPVDRLAEMNNLIMKANGDKCLDFSYIKMIKELRNVTWNNEAAEGGRQWMYQTCTEFGFFQTSTARPNLFSETFPVEFFIQQCTDIFGPRYNINLLEAAVERTNTLYGALQLDVSNVVFVHGSIDPWHALGMINSTNPQAPSIYINGTAHCANMYPPSKEDPPQLTQAREEVGRLIGEWLKNSL
ncbi:putative serine protease K12H4.7 [Cephus cinctus]|uniref:Serine protease K12H4.7 n=1 Tax=Cephus cinctus TaxID=211228 RepID=A0AAJ7CC50_CEPCN|nr:putative serine protease K12H4.7 [Cephus cinctus]XP_015607075.1 putative serine protease K12H4.7 [Cephus cinctus]XP_015607076.1 putative serine protease K12H4.7 [Cephus cinctus]